MSAATVLQAVSIAADILSTITRLQAQLQQVNAVVATANAQGRTKLNAEEWSQVTGADDVARAALEEAIARTP